MRPIMPRQTSPNSKLTTPISVSNNDWGRPMKRKKEKEQNL